MRTANEDLSKLPKWAKNRIQTAENHAQYLEDQINSMSREETNTYVDGHYSGTGKNLFLPDNSTISFKLGEGFRDEIGIRVAKDERGLFLHVSGNDLISIEPRSGNLVFIRQKK